MSDGNRVLEYIIRARDNASAVLQKTAEGFSGLGSKIGGFFRSGIGQMAAFAGITGGIIGALALLKKGFDDALEEQKMQARFRTLLGGLDAAKQRMAEIQKFQLGAAGGLFADTDIAKASQNLEILTEGLIGGAAGWKMIGDVATATGNTMEATSFAIGKAFGMIKEGMPVDRVIMQLTSLGIIGPETTKVLKDLEAAGASQIEKWDAIAAAIGRFNGATENMKSTPAGDMAQAKAEWGEALEWLGNKFGWVPVQVAKGAKGVGAMLGSSNSGIFSGEFGVAGQGLLSGMAEEAKAKKDAATQTAAQAKAFADAQAKLDATAAHDAKLLADKLNQEKYSAWARQQGEITRRERADAAEQAKRNEADWQKQHEDKLRFDAEIAKEAIAGDAEVRDAELRNIEEVQKARESAAAKALEQTKAWFADFGGQAQGEWGAVGPGARAWTAGAAAARMANRLTDKENARDQARAAELTARVARGATLSPQATQWLGDRTEYQNTMWLQKEKERLASLTKDRADKELKNIEKERLELARKMARSLNNVERDLATNLKAP